MRETRINRRPDGSIDTSHYLEAGRLARSRAAHGLVRPVMHPDAEALAPRTWLRGLIG